MKKSLLKKLLGILFCIMLFTAGCFTLSYNGKEAEIKNLNKEYYKEISTKGDSYSKTSNLMSYSQPQKYNDQGVPVLMYHSIGDSKLNPYVESKEKFESDMQYLKYNGFTTITTDELYDFLVFNKPVPKKSVLITFDDGYRDNYTNAYPILKKYGFKATFFVITDFINKGSGFLRINELIEMQQNGMDIESHTVHHDKLGTLSEKAQIKTLEDSKSSLEKMLNKNVRYISYPFGSYDANTLKAVEDCGYVMAFTTDGRWAQKGNGLLTLDRVFISGMHLESSFKTRVNTPWYLFSKYYLF